MSNQTRAGHLDPSFNEGKLLDLRFPGFEGVQSGGLVTDRNEIIYVSGSRYPTNDHIWTSQYFIVALDAQGRRYANFGNNGLMGGAFFKSYEPDVFVSSTSSALHYWEGDSPAEDRLYVFGRYTYKQGEGPAAAYPAVACHLMNGELDVAFGTDGICIFSGLGRDTEYFLAPDEPMVPQAKWGGSQEQPDSYWPQCWALFEGRFYIQGMSRDRKILLMVIDRQGVIDWSFGTDGVQVVKREGLYFHPANILVNADGIYLTGDTQRVGTTTRSTAARLGHDGKLDTSYGVAGFKDFEMGTLSSILDGVTKLSDDFFVTAGWREDGAMLLSYDKEGELNSSFNNGSPLVIEGGDWQWHEVAVDGRGITAIGAKYVAGDRWGFVGRFLLDGQLDLEFADGAGWRRIDELPSQTAAAKLIVRSDRSIVFLGDGADPTGESGMGILGVLTGQ